MIQPLYLFLMWQYCCCALFLNLIYFITDHVFLKILQALKTLWKIEKGVAVWSVECGVWLWRPSVDRSSVDVRFVFFCGPVLYFIFFAFYVAIFLRQIYGKVWWECSFRIVVKKMGSHICGGEGQTYFICRRIINFQICMYIRTYVHTYILINCFCLYRGDFVPCSFIDAFHF